jgi:serine protease Do
MSTRFPAFCHILKELQEWRRKNKKRLALPSWPSFSRCTVERDAGRDYDVQRRQVAGRRPLMRRLVLLLFMVLSTIALSADSPAPSEPVDDRRITLNLEKAAAELVAAGRTVKMAALIEQLQTQKCAVDLAAPSKEVIPLDTFYERMKPSVLILAGYYKCAKCGKFHVATASGYAISKSGVFVTNYHVVNSPTWETLVAMTSAGRVLPVRAVLAASLADDVAILQLDGQDLTPAAFAADAPVGSRVRVINHPDGRFFVFTEGVISRYFKPHGKDSHAAMMAITADFAKGSSGSPVFNECGAVVGMVASTASIYYNLKDGHREDLQMVVKECVPASSILKLIEGGR